MSKLTNEFKTIHWPTKKEMSKYLKIVLVGMFLLGTYITLLDVGFKYAIEKIISLF